MAAARIAAVVVALLVAVLPSVQLPAQPTPQGTVSIQVTDMTGAVIPGARIEIDPSPSRPESDLKTDGKGQAVLDLPAGTHTLWITYPAFKQWTRQIDVQSGGSQMMAAKLDVSGTYDPEVIVEILPDIPLLRPDPIFIPLQPLLNFDPLPSRPMKKRW